MLSYLSHSLWPLVLTHGWLENPRAKSKFPLGKIIEVVSAGIYQASLDYQRVYPRNISLNVHFSHYYIIESNYIIAHEITITLHEIPMTSN